MLKRMQQIKKLLVGFAEVDVSEEGIEKLDRFKQVLSLMVHKNGIAALLQGRCRLPGSFFIYAVWDR